MTDSKTAIAIDERTYREILDSKDGKADVLTAKVQEGSFRKIETPDTTYIVFLWDWSCPDMDDDKYRELLSFLETRRHSIVSIREDGEIFSDIETEDEFGEDSAFETILGWTANIVLWSDASSDTLI